MRTAYIGFNQGQYGDLFICLTAARVLKQDIPDSYLVYGVNKKYADCIDVLKLSKDIDEFIVWDGYDNYPLESDKQSIKSLLESIKCETVYQFHPMQGHLIADWYNYWHQTEEACVMHKLRRPNESEMDFKLPQPDLEKEKTITICTGRRKEQNGSINSKAISVEAINVVKNFAEKNDLKLIQIAGPEEEDIPEVEKFEGTYSESIYKVLRSKLLISCDTGMIWAASAFSHPCIGLYDLSYYPSASSCLNWTPKNKNQKTIFSKQIKNINLNEFEQSLVNIYNSCK
tara:strand:+ start:5783 stop:6640 length:858 start_codon:yes stop_codon:yes gene_type:complete